MYTNNYNLYTAGRTIDKTDVSINSTGSALLRKLVKNHVLFNSG